MATNFADKEREFLSSLEDDTGRDLAGWMAAIAEQNLPHRNDIIDWLRHQGFMFSKASWLERIHHNGGRPIYLDAAPVRLQLPRDARPALQVPGPAPASAPDADPEIVFTPPPVLGAPDQVRSATQPPERAPTAPAGAATAAADPAAPEPAPGEDDPAALDELVARAKAYRPLAQYLLAEITRAVPAAVAQPKGSHVVITARHAFAALAVGPKELRLALDLGPRPFDETVKPARFAGPPPPNSGLLTHMVVLTDARQVGPALLSLVKEAAARNP